MARIEIRKPSVIISAIFLGIVAVWYLIIGGTSNRDSMGSSLLATFKYETVTGFFLQDDPETDANTYDYHKHNFGLKEREYETDKSGDNRVTQWQRFNTYVQHLVDSSPDGTTYKVFYMGRHGEGYHNVGEAKYGTKAWDDYWSKLDGDGELFWDDAHLTETGKQQALGNNAFFKKQFAEAKMPAPERYYVSPLYRCLQTANFTFFGLELPDDRSFQPTIKELLREVMGEHTCDRRSSRTYIHNAFPDWEIESGFSEKDELWQADHRETKAERKDRLHELLDDIFEHDQHVFISLTSHSGAIAGLLNVLGHREFRLPTGALMPVLVKARRVS